MHLRDFVISWHVATNVSRVAPLPNAGSRALNLPAYSKGYMDSRKITYPIFEIVPIPVEDNAAAPGP